MSNEPVEQSNSDEPAKDEVGVEARALGVKTIHVNALGRMTAVELENGDTLTGIYEGNLRQGGAVMEDGQKMDVLSLTFVGKFEVEHATIITAPAPTNALVVPCNGTPV